MAGSRVNHRGNTLNRLHVIIFIMFAMRCTVLLGCDDVPFSQNNILWEKEGDTQVIYQNLICRSTSQAVCSYIIHSSMQLHNTYYQATMYIEAFHMLSLQYLKNKLFLVHSDWSSWENCAGHHS